MRRYECHKEVKGALIESMNPYDVDSYALHLSESEVVIVSADWIGKHDPRERGYFVEYEDGYQSYSPAPAFESGYTLIEDKPGD
jgi:hypothetical protein